MRTLTWEGIEFGDFMFIASIHLWNQSIENFMSSSPLGCVVVTSLLVQSLRHILFNLWQVTTCPSMMSRRMSNFEYSSHFNRPMYSLWRYAVVLFLSDEINQLLLEFLFCRSFANFEARWIDCELFLRKMLWVSKQHGNPDERVMKLVT